MDAGYNFTGNMISSGRVLLDRRDDAAAIHSIAVVFRRGWMFAWWDRRSLICTFGRHHTEHVGMILAAALVEHYRVFGTSKHGCQGRLLHRRKHGQDRPGYNNVLASLLPLQQGLTSCDLGGFGACRRITCIYRGYSAGSMGDGWQGAACSAGPFVDWLPYSPSCAFRQQE